jgi:hypothetical protein
MKIYIDINIKCCIIKYKENIEMQKFIFLEVHAGAKFDEINKMLTEGWKVVEIHASKPTRGENIHALVLIEKKEENYK